MTWIKNSFCTFYWLDKRCSVNYLSFTELFQRYWNKIHKKGKPSITCKYFQHQMQLHKHKAIFYTSWIGIALEMVKQCLISIKIFGLLSSGVDWKAASVEQESASADTQERCWRFVPEINVAWKLYICNGYPILHFNSVTLNCNNWKLLYWQKHETLHVYVMSTCSGKLLTNDQNEINLNVMP